MTVLPNTTEEETTMAFSSKGSRRLTSTPKRPHGGSEVTKAKRVRFNIPDEDDTISSMGDDSTFSHPTGPALPVFITPVSKSRASCDFNLDLSGVSDTSSLFSLMGPRSPSSGLEYSLKAKQQLLHQRFLRLRARSEEIKAKDAQLKSRFTELLQAKQQQMVLQSVDQNSSPTPCKVPESPFQRNSLTRKILRRPSQKKSKRCSSKLQQTWPSPSSSPIRRGDRLYRTFVKKGIKVTFC